MNLVEVFKTMKISSEKIPDSKADLKILQAYFKKIVPEMDFERVYASDMKKMIKWLGILNANNIELKLSELPAQEDAVAENTGNSPKAAVNQSATTKTAPMKKINIPRKMA